MKSLVMITLGICTLAGTAYGQMPRRQPGPEHARMAYFVGTWNTELVGERGPFKARLIMTEQSLTTYTFKLEGRLGDDWIVLEEGRASKVQ